VLSCKFSHRPRAIRLAGGDPVLLYTGEGLQAAREEGYCQGHDAALSELEAQFANQRMEVAEIQHQTLERLAQGHEALVEQCCGLLPGLVMEGIRRVLATVELDETVMRNIVGEMIAEVRPGTSGLEVMLNEHDLEFFQSADENLGQKYPGIQFVADPDLRHGDCMVRSRFGTLDGTLTTKLDNVEALLE